MSEDDEIETLWGLALTKGSGWQYSDFPVVRDSTAQLRRAWKQARVKTRLSNGESVTVRMVELQWQAEARARRDDRGNNQHVPQPVGVSVWLNGERWNNEIVTEEKQHKAGAKCKCGQPTHGPSFNQCADCMSFKDGKLVSPYAEEMRAFYKRFPGIRNHTPMQARNFIKSRLRQMGNYKKTMVWIVIKKLNKQHKNILLDKG